MSFTLTYKEKHHIVELNCKPLSRTDAMFQGFKFFAMVGGAAIASILIPIAHFVTVPIGLLCAPIVGLIVYRSHVGAERVSGEFQCLECQNQVSIRTIKPESSIEVRCMNCDARMDLRATQ